MVNIRNLRAGSIPSALKRGHGRAYYTNGPLVAGASSLPANTKQKEILKKIRALPLRKYGSAKHKKLIKEYIKYDSYFPTSKLL